MWKILFACLAWSTFAQAQTPDLSLWNDISGGRHSLQEIGEDYYALLPMKPISGARLVLFNRKHAKRLGLPVPTDKKQLEELILSRFGLTIDKEGRSPLLMMATKYMDNMDKSAGQANGDGRLVWAGEMKIVTPEGLEIYLDITIKGVGPTPFAWTNNPDERHRDGYQSMDEAVSSYVLSETAIRNGIDSTVDLAVIEIPFLRAGWKEGTLAKAAITVRVGNQMRLANFRYFMDDPPKFKKIFEYSVRRDMGTQKGRPLSKEDVKNYFRSYVSNLASEAAKYYDLNALHGSPTVSNRTSKGGTIDLGTFRYLDAHHTNIRYFDDGLKLGGKFGQTEQFKAYIGYFFDYMEKARYALRPNNAFQQEMEKFFDETFKNLVVDLSLGRIGLSKEEIQKVPQELREEFFSEISRINSKNGIYPIKTKKGSGIPAAFEIRRILKGTALALSQTSLDKKRDQFLQLFMTDKSWKTIKEKDAAPFASSYQALMTRLVKAIGARDNDLKGWIQVAQQVTIDRPGENTSFQNSEYSFKEVLNSIVEGGDFEKNSRVAEKVVRSLVDVRKTGAMQSCPGETRLLGSAR